MTTRPQTLSATTMIDTPVENPEGEGLGDIEEFMIDLDTGRVAYAVLSFGGIMGMGDKLFAIPWEALEVDTANERIILDVDKETLDDAPGFDKNNWPETADYTWLGEVYEYYGYTPYWR